MAEEEEGTEAQAEEPDYKALYEQAKAHSREWERKAKANRAAADELAKAQEAGKTAEERIAELTRRLDEKERDEARRKVAAKVAQEKGVPADLLVGDDEEAMADYADRLKAAFAPKPAPKVDRAGSFPREAKGPDEDMRDVLHKLFND